MITFQEALDKSHNFGKRHLLLGNGFSIALRPNIFTYGSLLSNADFSAHPKLPEVFEALNTTDFEVAIRGLEAGAALAEIYSSLGSSAGIEMRKDANALKRVLIETVTKNHPDGPFDLTEDEFFHCRLFLANFIAPEMDGNVFTLNYDLLLYWTLMHDEFIDGSTVDLKKIDGFGDDDPNAREDYVTWQGEGTRMRSNVCFLHGALHLFDAGKELQKFTWVRRDEKLKEQAWRAMQAGRLPLFVAEGQTAQKAAKIQHHAYLFQCLKKFRAVVDTIKTNIFIHGHSLADNDFHIFREIARGRCKNVFVSLHGDFNSENNLEIRRKAENISDSRGGSYPLDIRFYDAGSANVWG